MTAFNEQVSLTLGGKRHTGWTSYEIDSDLLIPADAWHVKIAIQEGKLPAVVQRGALTEVRMRDQLVLTGRIDDIDDEISKESHDATITGRDGAAILVDCSAPIFVNRKATLAEIVEKVVKPLGVTRTRIEAPKDTTFEKINVDPGDSAWEVISHAAEAVGLWPWFEPDGTLVVGGPDDSKPPVASLVQRFSGKGNNIERLRRKDGIAGCFSEVTVMSQSHTTESAHAKAIIKATYRDPSVSWYRPKIVIDHEADSQKAASARAKKLMADSRLNAFTLEATVAGHTINAPGMPGHGQLWTPGQRVHVFSEPHGIDAVFFLMARRFTGGRNRATQTRLTFKEDGMWIVEAHPHNKRHRRGRNGISGGEAQIYEVDN
ncbi:hypothetical protein LMG10661_00622 [Ralstonia syzygii subsp. syzygii]|nr:hypothetical protein LMG10661_00622 [Ralstonia syzygii subsp. syzygii]